MKLYQETSGCIDYDSFIYVPIASIKEFDEAEASYERNEGEYYKITQIANGNSMVTYAKRIKVIHKKPDDNNS